MLLKSFSTIYNGTKIPNVYKLQKFGVKLMFKEIWENYKNGI